MRTGSYLNAEFKGLAEKEFAWFGLLGNLPGFSVAANYAARTIVKAVQHKRRTCTISMPARFLIASEALLPEFTQTLLAAVTRYLLPASGTRGHPISGKILDSNFGELFGLSHLWEKPLHGN
jgi:hypothetical protein